MSMSCYYEEGGRPVGPVSPESLRALAQQGKIQPGTSVWVSGTPAWQSFADWEAAQPAGFASAPPPAPPAPAASAPSSEAAPELRLAAPRGPRRSEPEAPVPEAARAEAPKVEPAFSVGLATCRKCGKAWARAHLNEQRPDGPVCRACEARERQEAASAMTPADGSVTVRMKSDNRLYYILFFAWIAAMLAWFGPRYFLASKRLGRLEERAGAADRPEWGRRAPAKWPAIVLVNDARFRDGAALPPSSAVLVERRSDGKIFGLTAGTLFGDRPPKQTNRNDPRRFAGTLAPSDSLPNVSPASLEGAVQSWRAVVPGQPTQAVEFVRPRGRPEEYDRLGVQLFETNLASRDAAPATPLLAARHADRTPLLLVIRPAVGGGKGQEALAGAMTTIGGDGLRIRLNEPTPAAGLCGAPVLNAFGQIVGLVFGSEQTLDAQGRVTEVLAETVYQFAELIGE